VQAARRAPRAAGAAKGPNGCITDRINGAAPPPLL